MSVSESFMLFIFPVNQANPADPANPANPANLANPANPANPANLTKLGGEIFLWYKYPCSVNDISRNWLVRYFCGTKSILCQ